MDRLGWGLMAKSTGLVGKSTNYPGTKFQGSLDTSKNEKKRQKLKQKYLVFWLKSEDTALVGNP